MTYFKKISVALTVFVAAFSSFSLLTPTSVSAAEFESGSNISIQNPRENLYVSGSNVTISSPIAKDLVVAGGTVIINSTVERNIIAAAAELTLDSSNVGGAVRLAAARVNLSGTFNDDVVIAAGQVNINNAQIAGDLIITTGDLDITNSSIQGDLLGTYNATTTGNFQEQVAGNVDLRQTNTDEAEEAARDFSDYVSIASELSVIVALAILTWFLASRNRLWLSGVKFNTRFLLDFLIGLAYLILPVAGIIIFSLLFMYPLGLTLAGLIYILAILTTILLPIYVANLAKNSGIKIQLNYLVAISYLVLLGINVLIKAVPLLSILGLVVFVFFVAAYGYLMRQIWIAIDHRLSKQSEVSHNEPEVEEVVVEQTK